MGESVRPSRSTGQGGFTLVEILFALGVLVFGVTSLIGVFSVGVSTRRTAEQRSQAALLVDEALHAIEEDVLAEVVAGDAGADPDEPLPEIEPIEDRLVSGYPGMKYSARFVTDEERPWLLLVTLEVSWLEQGAAVGQTFRRILERREPFSRRVARRRAQQVR